MATVDISDNSVAQSNIDLFGTLVPLSGSATWDPASTVTGASTSTTVTVTGAALGDFAIPAFSLDLTGVSLTAYVSSANTVTVVLNNNSGSTKDLGSGTVYVRVFPRANVLQA